MSKPSKSKTTGAAPAADTASWAALMELARDIVSSRLQGYFKQNGQAQPTQFEEDARWNVVQRAMPAGEPLGYGEKVVFLVALTPHLQPGFWESLILQFNPAGGDFPELGGVKGNQHRGMLPTGETAQFVVAGMDIAARLKLQAVFDTRHFFSRNHILWLEDVRESEPPMSGRLIVSQDWLDKALFGHEMPPQFGPEFPAKLVTTRMTWEDLVLHPFTADRIEDIKRWLKFHTKLEKDANLSRRIQAGYRVLFFGPPGTGKTLTATLMGKEFKKDVYRVDLSQIVSKYIGETEKNLGRIFDRAQNKDWILFFDEADALFGKRTNVQSSHDKFANQEVSFLLQRIEDFSGLMILASNFKNNIDDAFLRRFHALVHFPMPTSQERLRLWQQCMPTSIPPETDINLRELAEAHEISGAAIVNILQHVSLRALGSDDPRICQDDLVAAISRELKKEDRSL